MFLFFFNYWRFEGVEALEDCEKAPVLLKSRECVSGVPIGWGGHENVIRVVQNILKT
jgi:hypothetical protein